MTDRATHREEPVGRLHRAVADLLQHHRGRDPLPVVITKGDHEGWGVAVVVDGYYSREDAAEMAEFWSKLLRRVVDELGPERWDQ